MRQVIGVIASMLILVGLGQVIETPAADTIESAVLPAAPATQTDAIEAAPTVADESGMQLAAWKRPGAAGGGCCNGVCPAPAVAKTVEKKVERKVTRTVEVTEEADGGRRHPVVGAVKEAAKLSRAIFGHERRLARRASRRGGC